MTTQLAWIGLGNMGGGMASNVVRKADLKNPSLVYDRTASRARDLAVNLGNEKVTVTASVSETVTSAKIIFTCLANDAAILENMQEALANDVEGKIFVDCTMVHPDVTKQLADLVTKKGGLFVAMPVLGSPAVAAAGALLCVLAGPTEAAERIRPYTIGVVGRAVIDCVGEPAHNASLMKTIANTFILNVVEVLAEGMVFAEKTSIKPEKVRDIISVLFGGPYDVYAKRMIDGDYHRKEVSITEYLSCTTQSADAVTQKPQVPVDMALKDANHALNIAGDNDCEMPALSLLAENLKDFKAQDGSRADSSGVYGILRAKNGLPFNN